MYALSRTDGDSLFLFYSIYFVSWPVEPAFPRFLLSPLRSSHFTDLFLDNLLLVSLSLFLVSFELIAS